MAELSIGATAPDFTLPRDGGGDVSLAAFKGKPVVVYFYPKDDTSGCTTEAKSFTELLPEFEKAGAAVIGISPDPVKSHDKFVAKHGLGVILGADEDKSVVEAYGVWKEKSMYGKTYMGVERSTFLIDKDGKIAALWPKVKVAGHAEAVLKAVQELG
ncbi:thioredoxin-dependent thiol peroxidase [Allorhizobium sp. BGMRC 0089]|uniref:thioredoxin-dependent thiol peroxidase n=1 Tax=Allorhizobium sonneratiae TaxID=2934936 RepID=UPI0020341574|nr:thioredoxin-dependent thiol peroxidase [Allorhizobium sonneratiae]MCM2292776.1 thioredoxin-dependent thiol peroxidase [Allorhizobium sonneratiae]